MTFKMQQNFGSEWVYEQESTAYLRKKFHKATLNSKCIYAFNLALTTTTLEI